MKHIIAIALLILLSAATFGQDKKPLFIGFQPGLTKEKFYEENEFDINIIPLVVQVPIHKRIDLRFVSLANYHFGDESGFSDLGFQSLLPIFFKSKENTNERSSGFYAAPFIGLGTNLVDDHHTVTLGVEPGYMFTANKNFTLSLGMQLGGSHFIFSNQENEWLQHFGFKINLGFWI